MIKLYKQHGKVERYKDGKCKECVRKRLRENYNNRKDEYTSKRRARMEDPIYRARQNESANRSHRKVLGIVPTRTAPVICECCGREQIGKSLAADHDHANGRFRGWLCSSCNLGLGKLGDTLDGVERARAYLLRAEFS